MLLATAYSRNVTELWNTGPQYCSAQDFAIDVRQTLHNCFTYNEDGADIVKIAQRLRAKFERLFSQWVTRPDRPLEVRALLGPQYC